MVQYATHLDTNEENKPTSCVLMNRGHPYSSYCLNADRVTDGTETVLRMVPGERRILPHQKAAVPFFKGHPFTGAHLVHPRERRFSQQLTCKHAGC